MLARLAALTVRVDADHGCPLPEGVARATPAGLGSPTAQVRVFCAQAWHRDPGAPKQTNLRAMG